MKHNLSEEVRRMQKLAGIITEIEDKATLPTSTKEPSSSSTNVENLPDEKILRQAIEKNPVLKQRLKNIGVTEIDGLFKIMLSYTTLENTSKTVIIAALQRALKNISPEDQTITTASGQD